MYFFLKDNNHKEKLFLKGGREKDEGSCRRKNLQLSIFAFVRISWWVCEYPGTDYSVYTTFYQWAYITQLPKYMYNMSHTLIYLVDTLCTKPKKGRVFAGVEISEKHKNMCAYIVQD
jgi:hypothetical protein